MKIEIQIVSLLYFFIYGLLIYPLRLLIKKYYMIYIINILLTLIFLYGLFIINDGIIHTYFIIMFIVGIIISKIYVNKIKNKIIILKNKKSK